MTRIHMADAAKDLAVLWRRAASGPVTVEDGGGPLAVVLSPDEYKRLLGSGGQPVKKRVSGITTDANELFNLPGDMFNNHGAR
jgi:hypothetical protein